MPEKEYLVKPNPSTQKEDTGPGPWESDPSWFGEGGLVTVAFKGDRFRRVDPPISIHKTGHYVFLYGSEGKWFYRPEPVAPELPLPTKPPEDALTPSPLADPQTLPKPPAMVEDVKASSELDMKVDAAIASMVVGPPITDKTIAASPPIVHVPPMEPLTPKLIDASVVMPPSFGSAVKPLMEKLGKEYEEGMKKIQADAEKMMNTPGPISYYKPPKRYERSERERLPKRRRSFTYEIQLDAKIYVTVGLYEDGRVGEVFIATAKDGSMLRTSIGMWSIALSKALQFGMPMREVIKTFRYVRCNEGYVQCEEVPPLHGKRFASSWDVITALLEAITDDDGKHLDTPHAIGFEDEHDDPMLTDDAPMATDDTKEMT